MIIETPNARATIASAHLPHTSLNQTDIRKFLKVITNRFEKLSEGVTSGKSFGFFGRKIDPTSNSGVFQIDNETRTLENLLKVALTTNNLRQDFSEQIRNAVIS